MKWRFVIVPIMILACITFPMCEEEGVIDPEEVNAWKQYTTREGIVDNEIWSIAEDLYGNIWVGTGDGLCRFDGNTWSQVGQDAYIYGYAIYDIEMDGDGNLWVGSGYGLDVLYQGDWYWIDSLFGNPITARSLYRDKNGDIWVGAFGSELVPGGLFGFDGEYWWKFPYFEQPGFNNIYCITEDPNGNMWFCTDAGAVKGTQSGYEVFNSSNGLSSDDVTAILFDGWNDTWFGTFYGEQAGRLHGNQMELMSLYHNYPISGVMNMTEDHDHNIWFGTGAGVVRYNGTSMDANVKAELTGRTITCSLTDHEGKIWFGTLDQGLFVYIPK